MLLSDVVRGDFGSGPIPVVIPEMTHAGGVVLVVTILSTDITHT